MDWCDVLRERNVQGGEFILFAVFVSFVLRQVGSCGKMGWDSGEGRVDGGYRKRSVRSGCQLRLLGVRSH